jgi:hypothetical protein
MFKNLPILIKQMIYFSCITLTLLVVGLVGLLGHAQRGLQGCRPPPNPDH